MSIVSISTYLSQSMLCSLTLPAVSGLLMAGQATCQPFPACPCASPVMQARSSRVSETLTENIGGWCCWLKVGTIWSSHNQDVERGNNHRPLSQLSSLIFFLEKVLFASYSLSFLAFSSTLFIAALSITLHQCRRKLLNFMQIRTQDLHLAE